MIDLFLADERIEIAVISGTSVGTMNALDQRTPDGASAVHGVDSPSR